MKNYEITVILAENEPDEGIKKSISDHTDKITHQEDLGVKGLAYPIKKQTIGHYLVFSFETEPEKLASIEKALKINPKVLRYLLIRDLREPSTKAAAVIAPQIVEKPKVEAKPTTREEKIKPAVVEEVKEPKVKEEIKVEKEIPKPEEIKPPKPVKPKKEKIEEKKKIEEISQDDLEKKLKELVRDE